MGSKNLKAVAVRGTVGVSGIRDFKAFHDGDDCREEGAGPTTPLPDRACRSSAPRS